MTFHLQTDSQTERQNSTMEIYLRVFMNWEQNNLARLLPIAEFTYHNAKNTSTSYTPFKLNCGYHPWVFFKDNVDPYSRSCSTNKLAKKIRELIDICQQNLVHAQKLQKKAYDKDMKPQSYTPEEKIWLNSKYIKIKQNQKLKAKFFGLFQILYLVGKQAFKLDLSTKFKIHTVFYMSLLKQDTTKKEWMNKLFPKLKLEFDIGNNKKYKVETIKDSAIYAKEAEKHLPGRYYLVFCKDYPEEENTRESSSTFMHLWKMIFTFHKNHPEKPTATSLFLNSTLPIAKPSVTFVMLSSK